MSDLDDVIRGKRAELYGSVMGLYGDPVRMLLVNKLVARVLNHFGGDAGRGRIAKPHTLIQTSIVSLAATGHDSFDTLMAEVTREHTDKRGLAREFPSLRGTSLLDLGSGMAHLGGWLSALGVKYIGVEPSRDLQEIAQKDPRLKNSRASFFEKSIVDFCEQDLHSDAHAPNLISIIGVLEHIKEPARSLRSLFEFMTRSDWPDVPILVATFDPDFFLPGLPKRSFVKQTAAHYGETETLGIRDPASWEELFVHCGFHVLEQRPVHISNLPEALSQRLHAEHARIFASTAQSSRRGGALSGRIREARVPPRQGPFYFWLLCPRIAKIEHAVDTQRGQAALGGWRVETFAEEEPLSVIGNLQPRIYRLKKGGALFDSPQIAMPPFEHNEIFGQLEASGNYFASRVLGKFNASKGTQVETIESKKVLRWLTDQIAEKNDLSAELFLGLVRNLISVQFVSLANARRSDSKQSQAFSGRYVYNVKAVSGKDSQTTTELQQNAFSWRYVVNIAACILQACTDVTPQKDGYRSRMIVKINQDDICKAVWGSPKENLGVRKLYEIMQELVRSNVIDTFSAELIQKSFEKKKVVNLKEVIESYSEYTLGKRKDNDGRLVISPREDLNVGWHAARFIHSNIPLASDEDVEMLALAISAALGCKYAKQAFKPIPMPKDSNGWNRHAQDTAFTSADDRAKLSRFINELLIAFNYGDLARQPATFGLSSFIVVRDIWALLACLLDRADMWSTPLLDVDHNQWVQTKANKQRIIAYIQECVTYAGYRSGFEKSPW